MFETAITASKYHTKDVISGFPGFYRFFQQSGIFLYIGLVMSSVFFSISKKIRIAVERMIQQCDVSYISTQQWNTQSTNHHAIIHRTKHFSQNQTHKKK